MPPVCKEKRLGIMVCEREGFPPFGEAEYFRKLSISAQHSGLTVNVFSPLSINWNMGTVSGYSYCSKHKQWMKDCFPLPDVVYDRCLYSKKKQFAAYRRQIGKLRKTKAVMFMGSQLDGKWNVLHTLAAIPAIRPYVPPTCLFEGAERLREWLDRYGKVLLKPHNGSQGKGVIAIAADDAGGYAVSGRDRSNRHFHVHFPADRPFHAWLAGFIAGSKYLQQPFLQLSSRDGSVYDIRILVQKTGAGNWQLTGMAVRKGQQGSITSNLHGGGSALEVSSFLRRQKGSAAAERILGDMRAISGDIPIALENRYGSLGELGIDLGIDQDGKLWILEVNSKPGRRVFSLIHDNDARRRAILNPIRYACFLLKSGGFPF